MTKKKEVKTPVPKPATLQAEEWQKSFNEQERELLELSIKSVNEFSRELQRVRTAMKRRQETDRGSAV